MILTGAEGDFSSGMDLRALAGDVAEPDAIDTDARMKEDPGFIYRGLLKTYRPTKPVIAAVEGVAIAGGTEILQGTDIRVAGRERALRRVGGALVAVPDGRFGGAAAPADPVRGGRRHPAHRQAHHRRRREGSYGLVSYVVPDGTALDKAREVAATVAGNGPLAVEAILQHAARHRAHERGGGVRVRAADRHGGDGVGRLQGGPEGLRREAHAQLPAQVAPAMAIDPRTPVLVGAGVAHQRFDDPADGVEAVELMTTAVGARR